MINDFASLQAAVSAQVQRRDLASALPELIQLAEAAIFRDLEPRNLTAMATGTTGGGTLPLPVDIARIERVSINASGADGTLDYAPMIGQADMTISPGQPRLYTLENGMLRLLPAPAGPYIWTVYYTPKLTPLSVAAPSNWLLLNAPDVYLYRTCMQVGILSQDDALIQRHQQFYADALASARRQGDRQRLPRAGGLRMRPPRGAR